MLTVYICTGEMGGEIIRWENCGVYWESGTNISMQTAGMTVWGMRSVAIIY